MLNRAGEALFVALKSHRGPVANAEEEKRAYLGNELQLVEESLAEPGVIDRDRAALRVTKRLSRHFHSSRHRDRG